MDELRSSTADPLLLRLSDCTVDLGRGLVVGLSGTVRLTTREAELLRFLAERPGETVSRERLLTEVWGFSPSSVSRACDNAMGRLRAKVERDPEQPDHLITSHGAGYRFQPAAGAAPPIESAPLPAVFLGPITVDPKRAQVVRPGGAVVSLTSTEVALLERLLAAGGATVDRDGLSRQLWGKSGSRALVNAIHRLRAKIEAAPDAPVYLLSTATGYRLVVPEVRRIAAGSLIGRGELVARVRSAATSGRFVVLCGPAGVGKTSVARGVAAGHAHACWVDAGGATTPLALAEALARGLDTPLDGDDPVRRLGRVLSSRGPLLVVLDEIEGAVDAVRYLLRELAAPAAAVLGTSRVLVGLDPDEAIEVEPLSVADGIALYLERAQRASPLFRARPEVLPAVSALVERLDGLPLAVELAAARSALLTPAQQLARLADRGLDLLADPQRTGRHGTLRDAIDGSWSLLDAEQREAMSTLGLFRTFRVADAEGLLGADAIDRVHALRSHSLVVPRDADGGLGMLEAIREYVDERRAALPDGGRDLVRRQLEWVARLGDPQRLRELPDGPEDQLAVQLAAVDELAAAARRAVVLDLPEVAASCAAGAAWAWALRGPLQATVELTGEVLRMRLVPRDRARLELARGTALLFTVGGAPTEALRAAVHAAREADDAYTEAQALQFLGFALFQTGRIDESVPMFDQGAEIAASAGHETLAAWIRSRASHIGERPDLVERLQAALVSARGPDRSRRIEALALDGLARCANQTGRLGEAVDRLTAALQAWGPWASAADRMRLAAFRLMLAAEVPDDGFEAEALALLAECRNHGLVHEVSVAACLGDHWLRQRRAREAHGMLVELLGRLPPDDDRSRGLLGVVLTEAWFQLGDPASARTLALESARQSRLGGRDGIAEGCDTFVALADALLGDGATSVARARRAVDAMTTVSPHAVGLAILARIQLLVGDRAGAEATRDEHDAYVLRVGIGGWASVRCARADLEAALSRSPG